ncbi:MAG: DUF4177 domain-containing protein [Opitutaceae bacterium]
MSLWEYKVITSGKGGFASPAMMEKFLNDLGREEWEIIQFHTQPDNFLAFTGMARRSTQRDWTLQDAAAAAAKAEADKLRVEFEAKFKAAASSAPIGGTAEERAPSFLEEKAAPDDGFRKPVDTSRDDDPESHDDEKADDWDKLTAAEEDELPIFFDAIKPHLRRNQRGPGMSVGVDYLAKKWDQNEDDLKGALVECGFVLPADEDSKAEYVEYDGDLYWLNINRRGELWINTKEKPRPVFRSVKATRVEIETPAPREEAPRMEKAETPDRERAPEAAEPGATSEAVPKAQAPAPRSPSAALPPGPVLLEKIKPHMRRNRRGPGGSGSMTFLARALRTNEADLTAAIVGLGLIVPEHPNDKSVFAEIGAELWWLNSDARGGLWINGREKKPGETAASAAAAEPTPNEATGATTASAHVVSDANPISTPTSAVTPGEVAPATAAPTPASAVAPAVAGVIPAVRLLLKETKTGSVAGKVERLAEEMGRSAEDLLAALVTAGLKVPEKAREKPVFVEHAGEILWLNKNSKDELWVNAKVSKFADKEGDDAGEEAGGEKPRRGIRSRGKKPE